jgi:hypothetical protein
MTNLLKKYRVKYGRLYHLRGPNAGKKAGNVTPSGKIKVTCDGIEYNHDDLLFLYSEQLANRDRHTIDINNATDYQTVSGLKVNFYNSYHNNAPPYIIHGVYLHNGLWYTCQWTDTGEAVSPEHNLELQ